MKKINHDYPYFESNFIFISNLRRFKELDSEKYHKCIVTSNIPAKLFCYRTEYQKLLNDCEMVQDNAGLMAIKFLKNCGAKKIILAGMDGYSQNRNDNFGDYRMVFSVSNSVYDEMNRGISKVLSQYNKEIEITFLTKEKYIRIKKADE